MKIKIITNSGYKYLGELIKKDSSFVELDDEKEGVISIPTNNISFMKEVKNGS